METAISPAFENAAALYRMRRQLSGRGGASPVLVEERDLALQAQLAELVGLGMLSRHQADVLHAWLTGPGAGGPGVEPPPIAFEDGRFGSTLYDTLRAAIVVKLSSTEVDDGGGPFDDTIDALLQAGGGLEDVVTAVGDFLDRLFA